MPIFSSKTALPTLLLDTRAGYSSLCSSGVASLKFGRATLHRLIQTSPITFLGGAAFLLFFITSIILSTSAQAALSPQGTVSSAALTSIRLSELLSNPQKDWDNDGDTGLANQWIELANTSPSPVDISHLELLSHGSNGNRPVLLSSTAQIGPSGFFVIFVDQVTAPETQGFRLFTGGQLDLIDGDTGAILDSVNYPALDLDLSYSRHPGANGGWDITGTPTPNAPNAFTDPGSPTPTPTHTLKPTSTPRNGKGGGGGGSSGGNATPTATPFPASSVVVPSGSALASQQDDSATDSAGGAPITSSFPAWLKIALLAALGAGLLVVIIWYIRSWNQEPESDG